METIVKYNNRKLYSNKLSKYVNLAYILDVVKGGEDVSVVEKGTSRDITTETLTMALKKHGNVSKNDITKLIRL